MRRFFPPGSAGAAGKRWSHIACLEAAKASAAVSASSRHRSARRARLARLLRQFFGRINQGRHALQRHLPRMKKSTANMDTRVEPLPNNGGRWSPQRKAALLLALDYDLISLKEAGARFVLSPDEVESWRRQLSRAGVRALRSTRLQHFPECRL